MRARTILPLAAMLGLAAAGCSNGLTGKVGEVVATVTGGIPDTKKKLSGERKPVFPEGVPGVPQGVPPELVKGYQPAPETAVTEPTPAAQPRRAGPAPTKNPNPAAAAPDSPRAGPRSIDPADVNAADE